MSEDIISALRLVLLADETLNALVGERVFGVELPPAEAASMPRQCVVLKPSGGPAFQPGSYIEHAYQRIDVFSYGETPFEADAVRDAVHTALRQLRRGVTGGTLIHWVQSAGGWASQRDADADWPMAWQSFQAFFALETAA